MVEIDGRSKGVELRSTLSFRYSIATANQFTAPNQAGESETRVTQTCGGVALSLYDEALAEALKHKWIESQKQGRDLGEAALKDWFRRHWLPFCRECRLEHIEGMRRWVEFAEHEFGQVYDLLRSGDLLLDRILDRMEHGADNLEIINWGLAWGLPMPRVLALLELIDINRARLEPIAFCG